jgi:hypothetical protein
MGKDKKVWQANQEEVAVEACVIEDHDIGTSKPLYESCFTLKEHKSIIHNNKHIGSCIYYPIFERTV